MRMKRSPSAPPRTPASPFPRIRSVFQRLGYSPAVATILALLCTECPRRPVVYDGKTYHVATGPRGLPQGACTSPALSNQVARRLDKRLTGLATRLGLRYTHFHTCALCSPTRSALLAGRNHHSCATGVIMEGGTGFPGYNSLMPKSCGTFAEVLRQNGYNTAWYGKNHNVPDWHSSQAGPFDLWPTGLGFEYFYGFIGGDTSQWAPAIFENIKPIEPPHDDKDYFFEKDMADKAIERIRMMHAVAPQKPWLTYYAPGTAHAPHHAPKDWIDRFKGKFDQGWDKVREETLARQKALGVVPPDTSLTERSEGIPAWDSLDGDHKKVFGHMMEVYAAALSYCDTQMGRILDAIEEAGGPG